jgi:hypothetical protein
MQLGNALSGMIEMRTMEREVSFTAPFVDFVDPAAKSLSHMGNNNKRADE